MPEMNRRAFLVTAATAAAAFSLPVLQPVARAAGAANGTADAKPVDAGVVGDYAKDGVTDKYQKDHSILLVREDGKLYACSSQCTHKFKQLVVKDDELYCPAHKSHFTFAGTVTGGPARRSLPRYAITKGDDGKITVDKSKSFEEKKWDDAASFVEIKA